MQRERTRNLGINDFVEYFHLPIEEAARRLNICPTVMKKICRKNGVLRWPYRKVLLLFFSVCLFISGEISHINVLLQIKSVERKISNSEKAIEESAGEEKAKALEEL